MIINCQNCGAKYKIDPDKIKGDAVKSKCRACGFTIEIKKPEPDFEPVHPEDLTAEAPLPAPASPPEPVPAPEAAPPAPEPAAPPKAQRLSLRVKMIALFFFIPILLVAVSAYLFLGQLNKLARYITEEGNQVVTGMAEQAIAENARAVAAQARLYLAAHPGLGKEAFNQDPEFVKIGIQKVGKTGYSCLYSIPDDQGMSSLWIHPNPKLVGVNVPETMKTALGPEFPRWWKIYQGAYQGKESKGYYAWKDADGALREKFMVCTPVAGTPFIVASTTYLDEFTGPMKTLETRAFELPPETRTLSLHIMGGTIFLIGLIVSLYGHAVTTRIKALTNLADRISIGELQADINIKSNDEIGDLAEAISRMQDSIRLSIERLRRKRQ